MNDVPIIERIRGVRIETGAHRPFPMDDPARVYFVEQGYLDIFAVALNAAEAAGRRRFVARVSAGEMAFGSDRVRYPVQAERTFGFLAVPSLNAIIIEGERSGVASEKFDLAATNWIDGWIFRLSEFLVRHRPPPQDVLLLEADPDVPYPSGSALSAQHMDVIWVFTNAPMRFVGRDDMIVEEGEPLLPVTEQTWFEIAAAAHVSAMYTPTALLTKRLWPGFNRFGVRVLEFALLTEAEAVETSEIRRRNAHEARRLSVTGAIRGFEGILHQKNRDELAGATGQTPLEIAVALVAKSCGASLKVPSDIEEYCSQTEAIEALARRSGIRTRWITLSPGWWRRDGPSFVGFKAQGNGQEKPLGLLSDNHGTYRAIDPETGAAFVVDERMAAGIASGGLTFYPPLPNCVENGKALLSFSMHRCWQDLWTVLGVGILGGLAALLTPILTGEILARIIPRADFSLLTVALGALLWVAFGKAVFGIVGGLALLRIESRVDERLQAAIWSRLVSLPTPFFRNFTIGDLENRANGISEIRTILTAAAVQAAIGGIFSIFSLGLLFYYSWSLALAVCGLLFVLMGMIWIFSLGQVRHYREVFRMQGTVNGVVFQIISGLAKLRVANVESYALARWAQGFTAQKEETLAALRWAAGQHAVIGMFEPLAFMIIFASIYYAIMSQEGTSFGLAAFLSFNAAFGQLTGSVITLTTALTTVIGTIPLLERVRPILDTRPESTIGIDPGDLKGEIDFTNVTFCYTPSEANAIDGVSFRIRQGDYVAFVGSSGCGKSTIYRLLLGFERPDSGTIFLDGHDLSSLDLISVRRRMGVVLQHGQIIAGNIFENIAGMAPLSVDEAWAAVRAAALEDDIRSMPMGMRTVLPEGGVGLSMGQKQRLLIARALARKPRLLLFDEATSALDNRAQAVVQTSLKKLSMTRVVIAHRLSSIRDVDRIYVLEAGRIVESGHFDQLIKRDGVFAALARRQQV